MTELREWNITHTKAGAIRFGQSNLDISDEMDVRADRARYEVDRAKDIALAATHGIDEVMKTDNLDALLFPGPTGAAIAAKPGYPTVIVPFGTVPNAPTAAVSGRIRRQARTVRRQLHRHGVQRTAFDRVGVCVRAGYQAAGAAAVGAIATLRNHRYQFRFDDAPIG